MKYRKIQSYKTNKENPFVDEMFKMEISNRRRYIAGKKGSTIVNSETGEVEGHQVFAIEEKYDKEEFIKVFRAGLIGMFDLSRAAIKVFAFVASKVKPNQGFIYLEIKDCMEYTSYKSKTPIMSGLAELIEFGFIARSELHYKYYINPNMFFNGNRVTFMNSITSEDGIDFKLLTR